MKSKDEPDGAESIEEALFEESVREHTETARRSQRAARRLIQRMNGSEPPPEPRERRLTPLKP